MEIMTDEMAAKLQIKAQYERQPATAAEIGKIDLNGPHRAGRVSPKKGTSYRSIIRSEIRDGRRLEYHATKGWRSYRESNYE